MDGKGDRFAELVLQGAVGMALIAFLGSKEFWIAIIGAVATFGAVWLGLYLGLRQLRNTELKRQRIQCAVNLVAYRHAIASRDGQMINSEYLNETQLRFQEAINSIIILFGDDPKIIRYVRDYRDARGSEEKSNSTLLHLLREVAKAADISLEHVSDFDINAPFLIAASPVKFHLPKNN